MTYHNAALSPDTTVTSVKTTLNWNCDDLFNKIFIQMDETHIGN